MYKTHLHTNTMIEPGGHLQDSSLMSEGDADQYSVLSLVFRPGGLRPEGDTDALKRKCSGLFIQVIYNKPDVVYYESMKRNLNKPIYECRCFEVYYESITREPKIRGIKECRCDERLQTKTKEFTRLPYTGLVLELEHLKIETRLISEVYINVFFPQVFFSPTIAILGNGRFMGIVNVGSSRQTLNYVASAAVLVSFGTLRNDEMVCFA